jgi:hypothetical protein
MGLTTRKKITAAVRTNTITALKQPVREEDAAHGEDHPLMSLLPINAPISGEMKALGECRHEDAERSADHDADGEVDHVAAQQE